MTDRLTVRLDDDLAEWVRAESGPDRSKAAVVRDALRAASEGEGPYAHRTAPDRTAGDRDDLTQRVEKLEAAVADADLPKRVRRLEAAVEGDDSGRETARDRAESDASVSDRGDSAPSSNPQPDADDVTDAQRAAIRDALEAGEYAVTDLRVDAITAVVSVLVRDGEITTSEVESKLSAFDTGLGNPRQWWAETARSLPFVESGGRGSNRYEWSGE